MSIEVAAGGHPLARMYLAELAEPRGYRADGGVAWRGVGRRGALVVGLGRPEAVSGLVALLHDGTVRAAHVPPGVPAPFVGWAEDWELRWTYVSSSAPP